MQGLVEFIGTIKELNNIYLCVLYYDIFTGKQDFGELFNSVIIDEMENRGLI